MDGSTYKMFQCRTRDSHPPTLYAFGQLQISSNQDLTLRQEPSLPFAVSTSCVAVQLVFSLSSSIQSLWWGSSYTYRGSIKPNFKFLHTYAMLSPARIWKHKRGTLSSFCKHLSCMSGHTKVIPQLAFHLNWSVLRRPPLRSYHGQGFGVAVFSIVNQLYRQLFLPNNGRTLNTRFPTRILHPSSNPTNFPFLRQDNMKNWENSRCCLLGGKALLSRNPDYVHVRVTQGIYHDLDSDVRMKYCQRFGSTAMALGFRECWRKLSVSLLIESAKSKLLTPPPSFPSALLDSSWAVVHTYLLVYWVLWGPCWNFPTVSSRGHDRRSIYLTIDVGRSSG